MQSDYKLHKKKVNHAPVIIEKCGCGGPMQLHPPHPLETHLSTDIISDDKPRLIGSTKKWVIQQVHCTSSVPKGAMLAFKSIYSEALQERVQENALSLMSISLRCLFLETFCSCDNAVICIPIFLKMLTLASGC